VSKGCPSPEDILGGLSANTKRVGKVSKWMGDNPEKAEVFFETVSRGISMGIPLSHLITRCQEMLGGPPGSITTIRLVVKEHVNKENQS
tara:strand:- start:397 stop:663 length:267 start_codon:yes stop_codon:yes gene_type:complete